MEELSTSCIISLGKYSEVCTSLIWSSTHELCPFADFVLYPLAVMIYSHKYNYMLSSVSYPSESMKLEMVLGNCKTHACICTHIHTYVNKYTHIYSILASLIRVFLHYLHVFCLLYRLLFIWEISLK